MLVVWLERAGALPQARHDDRSWLGEAERERHDSFGSPRRAAEFLAGRDLLRRMLVAAALVGESRPIALTGEGPPRLPERPDLRLSLSHRRGWQVGAVADAPVGVDIEIQEPREIWALAQRICTPDERQFLRTLSPDQAAAHVHELWALKEAAFKAAFPLQGGFRPGQTQVTPVSDGCGTARSWRWPDGRVLAVVGAGFDRFEAAGLDGASSPACWQVGVRYNP